MLANYIQIILILKTRFITKMQDKLTQKHSLTSISSVRDFLANLSLLQEKDEDLTTPEALSFLKLHGFSKTKSPNILYSKMSKAYLTTTVEELSQLSLAFSPTLGIKCNGRFLILSSSVFLKTGKECTLLDIMETDVPQKYFLSQEAIQRIMSKSV